jgi:hypothetical protein
MIAKISAGKAFFKNWTLPSPPVVNDYLAKIITYFQSLKNCRYALDMGSYSCF